MTKTNKFLFFLPRIISIAFILFLSLFTSRILIQPGDSFWKILIEFFMQSIPLIPLVVLLAAFWKDDLAEAITFLTVALLFAPGIIPSILINPKEGIFSREFLMIIFPLILIVTLFLINWAKSRKKSH